MLKSIARARFPRDSVATTHGRKPLDKVASLMAQLNYEHGVQRQGWKIDRLLALRSDCTQFGSFRFQMDARNRQIGESDANPADRHGFLPVRHRGAHSAVVGVGGNLVEQMEHESLVLAI